MIQGKFVYFRHINCDTFYSYDDNIKKICKDRNYIKMNYSFNGNIQSCFCANEKIGIEVLNEWNEIGNRWNYQYQFISFETVDWNKLNEKWIDGKYVLTTVSRNWK